MSHTSYFCCTWEMREHSTWVNYFTWVSGVIVRIQSYAVLMAGGRKDLRQCSVLHWRCLSLALKSLLRASTLMDVRLANILLFTTSWVESRLQTSVSSADGGRSGRLLRDGGVMRAVQFVAEVNTQEFKWFHHLSVQALDVHLCDLNLEGFSNYSGLLLWY